MKKATTIILLTTITMQAVKAKENLNYLPADNGMVPIALLLLGAAALIGVMFFLYVQVRRQTAKARENSTKSYESYLHNLDAEQIDSFLNRKKAACCGDCKKEGGSCKRLLIAGLSLSLVLGSSSAQARAAGGSLLSQPGIIITIILSLIPIILGVIFALIKVRQALLSQQNKAKMKEAANLATYIKNLDDPQLEQVLAERKIALSYTLTHHELSGTETAADSKGLLQKDRKSVV